MKNTMTEIRWHGRGGQGAKTVSQLLALALMDSGLYVQAFPEYGPERSGAPMKSYTRSSDRVIRLHCGITNPDAVVVLDDSLIGEVDVKEGIKPNGLILVNSEVDHETMKRKLNYYDNLYCVDGNRLAREAGGRYANVVIAGSIASLLGTPSLESLKRSAVELFKDKLNESVMEANLNAIESGYSIFKQVNQENILWQTN